MGVYTVFICLLLFTSCAESKFMNKLSKENPEGFESKYFISQSKKRKLATKNQMLLYHMDKFRHMSMKCSVDEWSQWFDRSAPTLTKEDVHSINKSLRNYQEDLSKISKGLDKEFKNYGSVSVKASEVLVEIQIDNLFYPEGFHLVEHGNRAMTSVTAFLLENQDVEADISIAYSGAKDGNNLYYADLHELAAKRITSIYRTLLESASLSGRVKVSLDYIPISLEGDGGLQRLVFEFKPIVNHEGDYISKIK